MPRYTSLLTAVKTNIAEIYLGLLLFVAIPVVVALYFDYRAALVTSFFAQTIIGILYIRRAK